jgi:hypothetical protein
MGSACPVSAFANVSISNVGVTTLSGDMDTTSLNDTVTGFPPGVVSGQTHYNDDVAEGVYTDAQAAFLDGSARPVTTAIPTSIGGQTFLPGVYESVGGINTAASTVVTLDGAGTYIFRGPGALTTGASSTVVLTNGANEEDVFWLMGAAATLGASSTIFGNVVGRAAVTCGAGSTVHGRVLSLDAAVTFDSTNIITSGDGQCAGASAGTSNNSSSGSTSSTSAAASTTTSTPTTCHYHDTTGDHDCGNPLNWLPFLPRAGDIANIGDGLVCKILRRLTSGPTFHLTGSAVLSIAAHVNCDGIIIDVGASVSIRPTVTLVVSIGVLTVNGGSLSVGAGARVVVIGQLNWLGGGVTCGCSNDSGVPLLGYDTSLIIAATATASVSAGEKFLGVALHVLGKLTLASSSLSCTPTAAIIVGIAAELHVTGSCILSAAANAQVATAITVSGGLLSLHASAQLTVGLVVQTTGQTVIAANARLVAALTLNGGLLLGFGECIGIVTHIAGRIVPGDATAVGTLTLGHLTQSSGAIIEIHLRGLLSVSSVAVLGNATLAAKAVVVTSLGGFLPTLPIVALPIVVAARITGATSTTLLQSVGSLLGCSLTRTSTRISLSILGGLFSSVDENGAPTQVTAAIVDEHAGAASFAVLPALVFASVAAAALMV